MLMRTHVSGQIHQWCWEAGKSEIMISLIHHFQLNKCRKNWKKKLHLEDEGSVQSNLRGDTRGKGLLSSARTGLTDFFHREHGCREASPN